MQKHYRLLIKNIFYSNHFQKWYKNSNVSENKKTMKYAMEIQFLVWKKLNMVAGLKLLMDHSPPTILIFDLPIKIERNNTTNLHIFITTQKAHTMNNMNYTINMDSTVPRSMDTGVS